MTMVDINSVKDEAEKELRDEKSKKAKEKIKDLLRKQDAARQVVNNIEREIKDAMAQIGEGTLT